MFFETLTSQAASNITYYNDTGQTITFRPCASTGQAGSVVYNVPPGGTGSLMNFADLGSPSMPCTETAYQGNQCSGTVLGTAYLSGGMGFVDMHLTIPASHTNYVLCMPNLTNNAGCAQYYWVTISNQVTHAVTDGSPVLLFPGDVLPGQCITNLFGEGIGWCWGVTAEGCATPEGTRTPTTPISVTCANATVDASGFATNNFPNPRPTTPTDQGMTNAPSGDTNRTGDQILHDDLQGLIRMVATRNEQQAQEGQAASQITLLTSANTLSSSANVLLQGLGQTLTNINTTISNSFSGFSTNVSDAGTHTRLDPQYQAATNFTAQRGTGGTNGISTNLGNLLTNGLAAGSSLTNGLGTNALYLPGKGFGADGGASLMNIPTTAETEWGVINLGTLFGAERKIDLKKVLTLSIFSDGLAPGQGWDIAGTIRLLLLWGATIGLILMLWNWLEQILIDILKTPQLPDYNVQICGTTIPGAREAANIIRISLIAVVLTMLPSIIIAAATTVATIFGGTVTALVTSVVAGGISASGVLNSSHALDFSNTIGCLEAWFPLVELLVIITNAIVARIVLGLGSIPAQLAVKAI